MWAEGLDESVDYKLRRLCSAIEDPNLDVSAGKPLTCDSRCGDHTRDALKAK